MAFNFIIFAAALYALTTEIIEDSLVLVIYQIAFGKRNVLYGLLAASVTVAFILLFLVFYGIPNMAQYSGYVVTGSGMFLTGLGGFWMTRFWLVRMGIMKEESEEQKSVTKSLAAFTMIFVESLEVLAILVPFVLTNHVIETSLSFAISIAISVVLMFAVGSRLRRKLANRLTQVKLFAGMALVISGVVIIFHVK
jgi:hypothetical protein